MSALRILIVGDAAAEDALETALRAIGRPVEIRRAPAHADLLAELGAPAWDALVLGADDVARRALQAAGGAVAIADAGRRGFPLVHVNDAFARLTGYAPAALLGRSARMLRAPGADRRALADLRAALRAGAPWTGTLLNARADGSTFLNELTLTPVLGADGMRTHVVAVARDVSEQMGVADRLAAAETRYGRVIDDLAAAELRYRELVEQIPAVVYVAGYAPDWPLHYISPQIEGLLGRSAAAFLADQELWYRLIHPDDVERVREAERRAFAEHAALDHEFRMIAADGRVMWMWERDQVVRDGDGQPLFSQGMLVDITAQRRAEEGLREERDRAQRYLDLAGMVVLVLGADERIALLNRAGHQLLGYDDGTLLGRNWFDLCLPEPERDAARQRFHAMLAGTVAPPADGDEAAVLDAGGEERVVRWNTTLLRDQDGRVGAALSSGIDVTERRRAERQITHLAYHDSLTGLPNRALLREHLDLALARARRNGGALALLYVDLDDFKLVNDSLGHAAGDDLLRRVAVGLRERTRATDLLARQGGDEFLILLADLARGDAEAAAQRAAAAALAALADPFRIAGAEFHVGASVGISLYPRDAEDADALLKHADAAMYQAKAAGPSEVAVYVGGAREPIERLSLSTRLRRAITGDELVLHWQPIVALPDGTVSAVEALVRWRDPDRGLLLPYDFVPFAEDTGLIDRLGSWVADAVRAQRIAWRAQGLDPRVHLNVSPRQMARRGFVADLVGRLAGDGLDLSGVTLEITESLALGDDGRAVPLLRELREAGLQLAIDDFGAGWSSLGRLRDLPVQVVKIDRSFLDGVPESPEACAVVSAMLALVEALGMEAVAEGVESEAQREFLAERGCPTAQGFLLGRPVPVDELDDRLRDASLAPT